MKNILNPLANRIDEEVSLNLANNAEIDTEVICEVLVGSCAYETSITDLYESSEDSPLENTILNHLREKLDLASVERVVDVLLQ